MKCEAHQLEPGFDSIERVLFLFWLTCFHFSISSFQLFDNCPLAFFAAKNWSQSSICNICILRQFPRLSFPKTSFTTSQRSKNIFKNYFLKRLLLFELLLLSRKLEWIIMIKKVSFFTKRRQKMTLHIFLLSSFWDRNYCWNFLGIIWTLVWCSLKHFFQVKNLCCDIIKNLVQLS